MRKCIVTRCVSRFRVEGNGSHITHNLNLIPHTSSTINAISYRELQGNCTRDAETESILPRTYKFFSTIYYNSYFISFIGNQSRAFMAYKNPFGPTVRDLLSLHQFSQFIESNLNYRLLLHLAVLRQHYYRNNGH